MGQTTLQGVDLKIERAKTHLADLSEAVKWALDSEGYDFRIELDLKSGKHIMWVEPFPFVVPEWSIIIGEILFHLRSALDHLANQLVILDKGKTFDKVQFPVHDSTLDKNGKTIPLRDLLPQVKDPKILKALSEVQPYQGNESLWYLKTLNNIDKHRLLLVVVCILNTDEMWSGGLEGKVSIYTDSLKEGSPIGCFDFHGAKSPPDFNPHATFSIAFDEPETVAIRGEPFDAVLGQLCSFVEIDVVEQRFRPMFP